MANRTRDYYRKQRKRHINRKKRIIKEQDNYWHYNYEGTLSKGKIHCSCWMCRRKSYQEAAMRDVRKAVKDMYELSEEDAGNSLREHISRRTRSSQKGTIKGYNKALYNS